MSSAEQPLPPPVSTKQTGAPGTLTPDGRAPEPSTPHAEKNKKGSRRTRYAVLVATLAVVAFGIWYFVIRKPEPRDDFGRFQGEWQLAVPTENRENQPVARQVSGVRIRVTGDRWVWMVGEHEQKRYAMMLRPETNPKEIDLTLLDRNDQPTTIVLRGIYTIQGDHAKVVTAPAPQPRPTDLDSTDNSPGWLLERAE